MWNRDRFSIGTHFLSPLFNGDYSGMSFEDKQAFDAWHDRVTHGIKGFHWSDEVGEFFAQCEVSQLGSMCVDVWLMYPEQ